MFRIIGHLASSCVVLSSLLCGSEETPIEPRWIDSRSEWVREIKDHTLDGDRITVVSSGSPATCVEYLINPLGIPFQVTHLVNGRRHGPLITRNPTSGSLLAIEQYDGGVLTGPAFVFYESGGLKFSASYANDVRNGQFTEYFANGFIRETGKYVNGLKEGRWECFSANGDLDRVVVYERGIERTTEHLPPPREPKPEIRHNPSHTQPGATDNPDDAQRVREEH